VAYQREDIEQVRAATNLVDLVSEVTKVKKGGRSTTAICPFHQEKTPSLSIDAARGLYHCFGCGRSGDIFRFVEETQALGFSDAVELLARRAGITLRVDPEAAQKRGRRDALVAVVEHAVAFFHETLSKAPEAGGARSYLRGRGYDADIVDKFLIGYAPDRWDALVSHLKAKNIKEEAMVAAGVAIKGRNGRLVDRFRGRVVFPIYDLRGDPVGFGARLLQGDGPKYLNSPETTLYHKSELLYGLNWAKSGIVRDGYSVVVEGYTDVIAMHEAGMPVAVATCGTALGPEHLNLLRRFSERVVLAFDSDDAGAEAALRGFDQSMPGDLDMRVAMMPEGMDPADLVANGELDALRKAVEESQPLMQFRIERELSRHDLTEPEARIRAARAAAEVVARHPDRLVRQEYAVQVSRTTGVGLADIESVVEAAARRRNAARQSGPVESPPVARDRTEQELLRAMLANHEGLAALDIDSSMLTDPDHRTAFELLSGAISGLKPGEAPDLGTLLGADDSALGGELRALALDVRPLADPQEVLQRLQVAGLERRIQELRHRLESSPPGSHESSEALAELIGLERQRHELGGQE